MQKILGLLLGVLIVAILYSCYNINQQTMIGQYAGEIYSNSEMGGYLILSLNDNNNCALTAHFYDSDDTFSTQRGKWSKSGKEVTLAFDTCTIKATVEDADKLKIVAFGNKGFLERESPTPKTAFIGTYNLSGVGDKVGFKQSMKISDGKEDYLLVSFSSTDSKDETLFVHKGKVVNNQIELSLRELNAEMNSTMVIRFEADNELNVSTSDFEQRYDLQYFCKGGGTLAGLYIKE